MIGLQAGATSVLEELTVSQPPQFSITQRGTRSTHRSEMAATTVAPSTTTAAESVDLATSILTILTTLCQASVRGRRESPECVQAQRDLLALVSLDRTPWIVRGSDSAKKTPLEKGLIAFMERASVSSKGFGLDRASRHEEMSSFAWGRFFRGLQGILAAGAKMKDSSHFVNEVKDYLIKDPDSNLDRLKLFLDFHQVGQLDSVLGSIHAAQQKSIYIIVGLAVFLVATTIAWLALNIRTYCAQRKLRKAQKNAKHAGILLRGMQNARRSQIMDLEAARALV